MTGVAELPLPETYRLIELGEIDSTNREALRRAEDGAGEGTVVLAAAQTAGRGRKGARWISPPGNLYASLIVEPRAGGAVGQLAFVAAVAAGEAVAELTPRAGDLRFKWPNDLLFGARKLAGILIEGGPRGKYVVGIGVNIKSAPRSPEIEATSLMEGVGVDVEPRVLLAKFCRHFNEWRHLWQRRGFAPVREAWLARAAGIGEAIDVRLPVETVRGVFAGLSGDGALLLDLPGGGRRVITAGAVYFAGQEAKTCC